MDGLTIIPANAPSLHPHVVTPARQQAQEAPQVEKSSEQQPPASVTEARRELKQIIETLDKRMVFRYHEELGQVVVKVIDRETDKVIKEFPPAELQRLHLRIREAIGLLIDERA